MGVSGVVAVGGADKRLPTTGGRGGVGGFRDKRSLVGGGVVRFFLGKASGGLLVSWGGGGFVFAGAGVLITHHSPLLVTQILLLTTSNPQHGGFGGLFCSFFHNPHDPLTQPFFLFTGVFSVFNIVGGWFFFSHKPFFYFFSPSHICVF